MLLGGLMASQVVAQEQQTVIALLSDGRVIEGDQIVDWNDEKKSPRINGQVLTDANNPARLIYRRGVEVSRPVSYVRFANGDVLAGRVVGYVPGLDSGEDDARLVVEVAEPVGTAREARGQLEVWSAQVREVVWDAQGSRGDLQPGMVRLADGRELMTEAIRWRADGLRVLGDSRVTSLTFGELAGFSLPAEQGASGPFVDWLVHARPERLIQSVLLSNGSVLTSGVDQTRLDSQGKRTERETVHLVQPIWSTRRIRLPMHEIAVWSIRRADEQPMSQLPHEVLTQRSATGYAPAPQLDRPVRGTVLTANGLASTQGIGLHATTQLALTLPASARSIWGVTGIDDAVGGGGCAMLSWHLTDQTSRLGDPPWKSGYMLGSGKPERFGPIDTGGKRFAVIHVSDGHNGRPAGADPLTIRDQVNVLSPLLRHDTATPPDTLAGVMPGGHRWKVAEGADRMLVEYTYRVKASSLIPTFYTDKGGVTLETNIQAGPGSGALYFSLGVSGKTGDHAIEVTANGKPMKQTDGQEQLSLAGRNTEHLAQAVYDLTTLEPGPATVRVKITQPRDRPAWDSSGLQVLSVAVRPIIEGRPTGTPITPNVPLVELTPTQISYTKVESLEYGVDEKGEPLHAWGRAWPKGVPIWGNKPRISYAIDPSHRRFVGVFGSSVSRPLGPMVVEADGKVIAEIPSRHQHLLYQVEADIPPGSTVLTIRSDQGNAQGMVIDGGFMLD